MILVFVWPIACYMYVYERSHMFDLCWAWKFFKGAHAQKENKTSPLHTLATY